MTNILNKPTFIIIHHSKCDDRQNVRDFESIKQYHISKGWDDIGYHYVIETVNNEVLIEPGREIFVPGAHAIDFNTISAGICIVGDYDDHPLEASKLQALLMLTKSLMLVFNIKANNVLGHRETYGLRGVPVEKSCPGEYIYMSDLRLALQSNNCCNGIKVI